MKKTLNILWMLLLTVGIIFPNFYGSLFDFDKFGATNFPTSLDSLTNPNPTDSVAVVSHSAQHANANDAIEALEAKLGITGSVAVTNSIFAGNGSSSSIWTTYPTSTNVTATGLGSFGNLLSMGSSTIVGGLTITGNSTTTNATSTVGAFTSFSTTTRLFGAGLDTCTGSSFLQWNGGFFGCSASTQTGQVINYLAATSSLTINDANMRAATTTYALTGERFMIWAKCWNNAALPWLLNVKPTGSATSTIGAGKSAANSDVNTFGIYTAIANSAIEIYLSDQGANKNYADVCRDPQIMYQRFNP